MKRAFQRFASIIVLACVVSCGGGDGAGSDDSVAKTLEALNVTNLSSSGFPWNGAAPGLLKRWELPIPVKTGGDSRAIAAIDEIERQLGRVIFDRTSIVNLPDASITRGIIVSVGTAYLPPGTSNPAAYCANASSGPNQGGWPFPAATTRGVMAFRMYVNLDNPFCKADQSIAVHEFGHALGMGVHFEGFGFGPAISSLFWRVLRTIYANAPGTPAASIVVP